MASLDVLFGGDVEAQEAQDVLDVLDQEQDESTAAGPVVVPPAADGAAPAPGQTAERASTPGPAASAAGMTSRDAAASSAGAAPARTELDDTTAYESDELAADETASPGPDLAEALHRRLARRGGRRYARPRGTSTARRRTRAGAPGRELAFGPMQLARARGTTLLPGQRWSETTAHQTAQALDVLRHTLARVTGNEDALATLLAQTGIASIPGRPEVTPVHTVAAWPRTR